MVRKALGLVALGLLSAPACSFAAEKGAPVGVIDRIGVTRGICVVLEDKECRLAQELVRGGELTVFVQLAKAQDVEAARRAADAAGLNGRRIFVAQGDLGRIHLADNVADAVVATGEGAAPKAEILRVLRPQGKAIVGAGELTKPFPDGVDDWRHHYHGPDNNPQSADRQARAPFLTQFVAEPRYAPAPQAVVAAGGRIFMAFGHVAWHQREEPMLNTLVAMNGFNGTILWKQALKAGIMVDRCTMIATPTTLYLADDASCKLIDALTGKLKDEIVAPADLAEGKFWKWMAMDDGVLYALVGKDEPQDPDAKWSSDKHGWPWGGISKGYNQQEYPWGFGQTLMAIDPNTKKVLWHHREEQSIDGRGLCMRNGRMYLSSFGKYLACLDAKTGSEVWRRTAEKDADLFKAIGPYRPGHGYVGGWKSTVYLKCTDKAVYFIGPQVEWLTAVSAANGDFLWKHPAKDLHVVIRDDGLYTIGPQSKTGDTCKLDPLTGKVLATYPVYRRACTRSTGGPDGIFFRGAEGTCRLDMAAGKPQWIGPMRPSCHVGVIVASGHLYWVPWACDCDLQMFGVICCAPAGDFKFDQEATDRDRLDSPGGDAGKPAELQEAPTDWPTYRADNARSARTQAAVPDKVKLLWQFAPKGDIEPTAPVTAGGLVFVGGSDGAVRAFDAANGQSRWTAYTGGAIRYPPAISSGRAVVGSGDGWVYAFEAATGKLMWRFRAAPSERRIPIHGSLLSTWPVANVMVEKDVVYAAAGINSFDGTHVYALDAATGRIKWQNNDSGHLDRFSRRGVAAQGDMLLHDGELYLAGGNVVSPGMFDTGSGKCLNIPPTTTGSTAPRGRELALVNGQVTASGQPLYSHPASPVFDASVRWNDPVIETKNAALSYAQGKGGQDRTWTLAARDRAGGKDLWAQPLPGEPVRWGAAVDRGGSIVVCLRDGRVLCYGAGK